MYVINSVDNTKLPYLDYNPDSNPNPRSTLDALREKQEGLPENTWRRTEEKEEKEMGKTWNERHQAHGRGPIDAERARCCSTCHLGAKGMSE